MSRSRLPVKNLTLAKAKEFLYVCCSSKLTTILSKPKMLPKLAILCCLIALTHAVPNRVARIAGGGSAEPGQYPYYVSLYFRDTLNYYAISFCGGAILNNQWIITAAYCAHSVQKVNEMVVKAGNIYYKKSADTEQRSNVVARFVHSKYNDPIGPYDIALLKLETPFKFNDFVAPIELPQAGVIPTSEGTLTGLGSLKHMMTLYFPDILQYVKLPIIDNEQCKKEIFDTIGEDAKYLDLLDEIRFCTGATKTHQGYCLHDSGDPLTSQENGKNVLIGIATFGFAADCESPGLPSIYTRVSAFNDWIQETISKN